MTKHLSQSQISTFLGCQRRWAYSRVEREPRGAAAVLGTVVHYALEQAMRDVAEGKGLPDLQTLKDLVLVNWEHERTRQEVVYHGTAPALYPLRGERMVEAVYPLFEHITPASADAIEQRFSVPLDEPGWTLDGVMDLVTTNGVIVDWKTTSTPWPNGDEHTSLQVAAYYLGYRHLYGDWPTAFTFVVVSLPRLGNPETPAEVQVLQTQRTEDQVRWYQHLASSVARQIDACRGVKAFPPNPSYRWCSRRFCHWWDACMSEGTAAGEVDQRPHNGRGA